MQRIMLFLHIVRCGAKGGSISVSARIGWAWPAAFCDGCDHFCDGCDHSQSRWPDVLCRGTRFEASTVNGRGTSAGRGGLRGGLGGGAGAGVRGARSARRGTGAGGLHAGRGQGALRRPLQLPAARERGRGLRRAGGRRSRPGCGDRAPWPRDPAPGRPTTSWKTCPPSKVCLAAPRVRGASPRVLPRPPL